MVIQHTETDSTVELQTLWYSLFHTGKRFASSLSQRNYCCYVSGYSMRIGFILFQYAVDIQEMMY
jgi:hypothetical protein